MVCWYAVFANFYDVNIPTVADFMLSIIWQQAFKISKYVAINFGKPVLASTSTALSSWYLHILDSYAGIIILFNYLTLPSFNYNLSIKRVSSCKTIKGT